MEKSLAKNKISMHAPQNSCLLIILDGWGIAKEPEYCAIHHAKTPYIDRLYQQYPHTSLVTHGKIVGLPNDQMGNSEVGHIHIGAGRTIKQSLMRINKNIQTGNFFGDPKLKKAFQYAIQKEVNVHYLGLVSDGGVHADIGHLKALCKLAATYEYERVFIHAFTDGRDTDPYTSIKYLEELTQYCQTTTGQLASITGRYYAMDRDKRWQRTQVAYDACINGKGHPTTNWQEAIKYQYSQGISDEFLTPIIIESNKVGIQPHDVLIFFNFRPDRIQQLVKVIAEKSIPEYNMKSLPVHYYTFTNYGKDFKQAEVIFPEESISETLGEVISKQHKTQLRISETEKYPHITYFLSGGRENPFPGEERFCYSSLKRVNTYDKAPNMQALKLTDKLLKLLSERKYDFICINFPNLDMVGHSGNFEATIQACEVIDTCLKKIIPIAIRNNYQTLITADHGNADKMKYADQSPHTKHTINEVPCILANESSRVKKMKNIASLLDIAPTVLSLMGISKPNIMIGEALFEKKN